VKRSHRSALFGCAVGVFFACSAKTSKERFELAETLWNSERYVAAAAEYERVANREKEHTLGLEALYKLSMTQYLYLNKPKEALLGFQSIITTEKKGVLAFQAFKHAGEILFLTLEDYSRAEAHYAQAETLFPETEELPKFLYRLGKSQLKLGKISTGMKTLLGVEKRYPKSEYAEKSELEIVFGTCLQAERERTQAATKEARSRIDAYLKAYPESKHTTEVLILKAQLLAENKKEADALLIYEDLIARGEKSSWVSAQKQGLIEKAHADRRSFGEEPYPTRSPEKKTNKEEPKTDQPTPSAKIESAPLGIPR